MRLKVEDLTPEAFEPFGTVIERPHRPEDAAGPGWTWWGETAHLHANGARQAIGYLRLDPAELRFDWAERHMRSAELVVPVESDCVLYAGPAEHIDEPGRLDARDRFRAFRVRTGQAAVLAPGVWHGAPFALDRPGSALVFLREGTGRDDTYVVRFEDEPVEITV
jgi:ureidoglycolate lyase